MFKLLKYELKARNKIIFATCIALILINLFALISFKWGGLMSNSKGLSFSGDVDLNFTSIMSMLVAIIINGVSMIVAIIMAIRILLKDIFSDSGKLLFTLPKNGCTIVGAKLISAAGEFLIYFSIILVFAALHVMKIVKASEAAIGKTLYLMDDLLYIAVIALVGYVFVIVLAYFSIILFRSIAKTKSLATVLAVIAFFALNGAFGAIGRLIKNAMPIYIELQKFTIESTSSASITQTSVTGLLFKIVVAIVLFAVSASIIEKRVEI
ncbi:hypothetical protein [Clostridium cellulovorans]|uniref:Uncharacterized protein n=1 Tax=Clostridium cellulovorans (strain ATCC 35296 / DSM 3052 / OCM 3 / 743B) TaxID=573061 RepID=D9SR66_CLOC7|nr:hypothetical protein [Clostridium cellulovorans]ADL50354.1 hypothetical protein Clocel_0583 [Clostridium cellulovorans 743B]